MCASNAIRNNHPLGYSGLIKKIKFRNSTRIKVFEQRRLISQKIYRKSISILLLCEHFGRHV